MLIVGASRSQAVSQVIEESGREGKIGEGSSCNGDFKISSCNKVTWFQEKGFWPLGDIAVNISRSALHGRVRRRSQGVHAPLTSKSLIFPVSEAS
jgi:hypothetical protein